MDQTQEKFVFVPITIVGGKTGFVVSLLHIVIQGLGLGKALLPLT